jgi:ferredoxin-thioredoxin reductase catalytic subunit
MTTISIESVRTRAEADAKTFGYFLAPDPELLQGLVEGLKINEERYGYPSCPCRLATGNLEIDRDIICPCDYRDPDVAEYGACYCALYMRKDLYEGKTPILPIPERRPAEKQTRAYSATDQAISQAEAGVTSVTKTPAQPVTPEKKLWYCRQCGYVVFREDHHTFAQYVKLSRRRLLK